MKRGLEKAIKIIEKEQQDSKNDNPIMNMCMDEIKMLIEKEIKEITTCETCKFSLWNDDGVLCKCNRVPIEEDFICCSYFRR